MSIKSFIMYESWEEQINYLTDEEAGKLLKAVYEFNLHGVEPVFSDRTLQMLFSIMRREFEIQKENYEKKVAANRENGKKGGRPRTQDNPENPVGYLGLKNNPENLKDKDKDKDKDRVKDKDIDKNKDSNRDIDKSVISAEGRKATGSFWSELNKVKISV